MSLVLNQESLLNRLTVKTFDAENVLIGDIKISMQDFVLMAQYVLESTDLSGHKDSRLRFVQFVRKMHVVKGFNENGKRLLSYLPEIEERTKDRKLQDRDPIEAYFNSAKAGGFRYMLVIFGFGRTYSAVQTREDVLLYIDRAEWHSDLVIEEVYDLEMDFEQQLQEPKAWNI